MVDHYSMELKRDDMTGWPSSLGETPWLLYSHNHPDVEHIQTFYAVSPSSPLAGNTKSSVKSIPQLQGQEILAFSHGWLVLQDQKLFNMFSLFNPVTLEFISLAPLLAEVDEADEDEEDDEDDEDDMSSLFCSLTSPPNSEDCVLFLWSYHIPNVFYCRPKQQPDWVTLIAELDGEIIEVTAVVVLDGVLYGLGIARDGSPPTEKITRLFFYIKDDLNSLTFCSLDIPEPHFPLQNHGGGCKEVLVESCHRVYRVFVFINVASPADWKFETVRVFELDLDGLIWQEINSLDGRAFFLSSKYCTWCWGTTNVPELQGGIQRNCIYFFTISNLPMQHCFSYNVVDQSFIAFHPCPDLLGPVHSPVWIVPQHLRLYPLEEWKAGIEKEDFYNREAESQDLELSQHNVRQESVFDVLPLHLVELISKYMHLFEYWKFRTTCKTILSAFPAPQWGTNNVLPLFLLYNNYGGSCELIDPCRYDTCSSDLFLFPDPFTIQCSKNGWLLSLVGPKAMQSLQFFNVYTQVWGEFTPIEDDMDFKSFAFSTNPTCSDCLTVGMADTPGDMVLIYYHQSGKETWNEFYVEDEANTFRPCFATPVFHEGAFYFLDMQGCLGAFQLIDGKPNWQVCNKPQTMVDDFVVNNAEYTFYLVECAGFFYSVYADVMGTQVHVFKFDELNKCWVKVDHLGNHNLFISRASCYGVVTRDCKMRNRIYFPRLRGKSVMFYSQDTMMYHYLGSDESLENLYGTTQPLKCCWI